MFLLCEFTSEKTTILLKFPYSKGPEFNLILSRSGVPTQAWHGDGGRWLRSVYWQSAPGSRGYHWGAGTPEPATHLHKQIRCRACAPK